MKKDITILENEFTNFVKEIKSKILSSQYEALKAVNKELINLYWDIGKDIVEKQEKFGWGKAIVQNLSNELQKEFIGIKGFVFKTRTGEISVHAKEVTLLSKSLRPLPEKFHGLSDIEERYRRRYQKVEYIYKWICKVVSGIFLWINK